MFCYPFAGRAVLTQMNGTAASWMSFVRFPRQSRGRLSDSVDAQVLPSFGLRESCELLHGLSAALLYGIHLNGDPGLTRGQILGLDHPSGILDVGSSRLSEVLVLRQSVGAHRNLISLTNCGR